MNFLRTAHFTDSWFALPQGKRAEITTGAVAFHEKYRKAGKLKDTYTFVPATEMMSIWDVASLEELALILSESPHVLPYVDSEVVPFLDHQAIVKLVNEQAQAAKKTAKK